MSGHLFRPEFPGDDHDHDDEDRKECYVYTVFLLDDCIVSVVYSTEKPERNK